MASLSHAPRIDPDEVFRRLVLRTASETGEEFLHSLVQNIAAALQVAGAWVTEYVPAENKLRTLAFWMHGRLVEPFDYALSGTPCEPVICDRRFFAVEEGVFEQFPKDLSLNDWGAVSYLGVPLLDAGGHVLGHLGAFDTRPLAATPALEAIFSAFATRAAAEFLRLRAARELGAREAQLSGLVDSAMDAILVLDCEGAIARVNPAALRVFGCAEEDLQGEHFVDFLDQPSARRFTLFLDRLADPGSGDDALWVPQSLQALRWDHSVFPAEMTLSRFATHKAACFTVILRNVDERVDAARRIRELTEEAELLRAERRDALGPADMIGRSRCMRELFENIERVAPSGSTVLIHGETGTGKELVARAIHLRSARAKHALVKVNCAAIPAALMESEFFGHEKGAFTGATARREGRFALAHQGTLFLDEVGELSIDLQSKLLRVIQEGEYEPVGGNQTIKVDVRLVAATNRDLAAMVAKGQFREDLFFRLNVFPLNLPPLRERGDDIGALAQAFAERLAARMGRAVEPLEGTDAKLLRSYGWPGNVRELQNVIERAIILSRGTRLDLARAMPQTGGSTVEAEAPAEPGRARRILTARELREVEADNLRQAMESAGWRISGANGAASLLGLPPTTVSSRLKALGIRRPTA